MLTIFRDYKKEGVGILIRTNGDRYEGIFENDKANGFGTIFFCNGD